MTIIATIIVCISYFLLLFAIVAFVQDKKWMGSAAKEVLEVIPDRKERFQGAHAIGWCIVGPQLFGYNMKSHIIHFIVYIPVCLAAAGVCTLF